MKVEFKTVAPDDPAAIVELRTQVQQVAEGSENLREAEARVLKIVEAAEEQRVANSEVVRQMKEALSTLPDRRTTEADPDVVTRMVQDVRMDADLQKEARNVSQGHFAIVAQPIEALRIRGGDDPAVAEALELQRLNDVLLLESVRRSMWDHGFAQRGGITTLPHWKRYKQLSEKFARALNETNATEGLNWVPTILSGNVKRLIQIEQRLASYFQTVPMTSKTLENPVEGADFFASYINEGTSDTTSDGAITPTQYQTLKATWTARKFAAAVVTTREIEADAVVDMVADVLGKIAKALRRAEESGLVNGQRTSLLDVALTIAATDHRKAWDGFRYAFSLTGLAAADFGAGLTAEGLLTLKGQMNPEGKAFGLDPTDMIWVPSAAAYVRLLSLKGSSGNAVVLTQDVAGQANTFGRGQLGEMFGSAIVPSEFVSQSMNSSGLVQASGGTKTALYAVSKSSFAFGERLGITLDASKEHLFLNDKMVYRGIRRQDFQCFYTPSAANPVVAAGVNISGF